MKMNAHLDERPSVDHYTGDDGRGHLPCVILVLNPNHEVGIFEQDGIVAEVAEIDHMLYEPLTGGFRFPAA